jgi:adenylate cyclase
VGSSATRVSRGFAFLDLCEFTDFVDRFGDDAAVAELAALRSIVRDVAPEFGVRVDKWLGDGVMVVGVEVSPLVAAVVEVARRFRDRGRLRLRGGIAAGLVILLEGDDYVGRAVNLAARLCDQARPGQILAAEAGLVLPDGVTAGPPYLVTVAGFAEPVSVTALSTLGEAAAPAPA